nr:C-type lectin domain family 6 member A-like [Salvelinus alpinus]
MGESEPGQLHPKKMEGSTVRDWWHTQYRQLSHYLALLCFLLTVATLLQTFYRVAGVRLKDLTQKPNTLNNSYLLLFHKYPALNLYSPVTTPSERECRPCPEGWMSFGERCCLYTQERQNWISSQYHCASVGGNLATVKSEEEQIFPWKRAKELSQGDSYWIGLKNGNPGGADNSLVEKGFWDISWYHEPEKGDTRELCARLSQGDSHRAGWYATMCKNSLKTICEDPGHPAVTFPYSPLLR